jgi:hypothetical protein
MARLSHEKAPTKGCRPLAASFDPHVSLELSGPKQLSPGQTQDPRSGLGYEGNRL